MSKNNLIQEKIQQVKLLTFKKELEEKRKENKYYLSLVAVIKDESQHIEEWLDYYINLGVEHFYLYDNKSMDDIFDKLTPYAEKISYVFSLKELDKTSVYAEIIKKHSTETRWLAFIDVDEFICFTKNTGEKNYLANFMHQYEDYPALVINRLCFDSNNHTKVPEGSVLENYTRIHEDFKNAKENKYIKSIVDPLWIEAIGIYGHNYKFNQYAVNENCESVEEIECTKNTSIDKIRINYYQGRLKKDWNDNNYNKEMQKNFSKAVNFEKTIQDTTIFQYIIKKDNSKNEKEFKLKRIEEFKKGIQKIQKNCKYYLSIVAILKNEALYIKEWLDYHINMGVEHFYLYDNESTDNIKEILQPYIEKNYITYTFYPGKAQQRPAYRDMMSKYAHESHWLAVVDIDEFICPVEKISIADFMRDYEDYPALKINCLCFDSNGHETKPKGSVLENYTRCQDIEKNTEELYYYKSIVNPLWVKSIAIHSHSYKLAQYAIDENFNKVSDLGFTFEAYISKIRINHYHSKSKEEFYAKVARGRATVDGKYPIKEEKYNFPITTHDYTILQHIKK